MFIIYHIRQGDSSKYSPKHRARYLLLPTTRYHDTRPKSSIHQIIRAKRHIAMPEMPILSASPASCPLLELGVSFVIINYIYLSFMQIHAVFYFNYINYSGLLIFCCQNVATHIWKGLGLLFNIQSLFYD